MSVIAKTTRMVKSKKKINLREVQSFMNRERVRNKSQSRYPIPKDAKCAKCGTTKNLTRHHEKYLINKFIILCKECHKNEHRG